MKPHDFPEAIQPYLAEMLSAPRPLERGFLRDAVLLTDDSNPYASISGSDQRMSRKEMTASYPPEFLVN